MITIDVERCTGCGACVEICPTSALYLVDGRAAVDNALCSECEACLDACANEAIALAARPEATAEPARLPARRPEPEVIQVRTPSAPVPLRARVLPVVGAALAWAGREIMPRMLDVLLEPRDRQATGKPMTARARSNGARSRDTQGSGRQHRHRRRGGG